MTRQERKAARAKIRQLKTVGRGRAILQFFQDALSATTTYSPREPRRRVKVPWRPLYGSYIALEADGVLGADGKPTGVKLVRKWTHQPGDIVEGNVKSHTDAPLKRYMVRPDHSLRAI